MGDAPGSELTPAELRDLRRLAGIMVPASTDYRMPGADDEAIFADIVRSLGRDRNDVRKALAMLREMAGGDFAALDEAKAEATAMALLGRQGPEITALGRAVLQCYYRDDRVIAVAGPRATAAFPEGPCPGAGRLVAARRGAQPAADVARRGRQGTLRMAAAARSRQPPPDRCHRRRAHHRRGRLGRRGGLEPRRHAHEDPVSRAGRLGQAHRFPHQRPRLGSAPLRRFRHQPEPSRARHRLPRQRRQLRDEGRQLQRRRRRHDPLHGAFPAPASVRLPRAGRSMAWRTTGRSTTGRWSPISPRTTA